MKDKDKDRFRARLRADSGKDNGLCARWIDTELSTGMTANVNFSLFTSRSINLSSQLYMYVYISFDISVETP